MERTYWLDNSDYIDQGNQECCKAETPPSPGEAGPGVGKIGHERSPHFLIGVPISAL